jgi:hypothetical protein
MMPDHHFVSCSKTMSVKAENVIVLAPAVQSVLFLLTSYSWMWEKVHKNSSFSKPMVSVQPQGSCFSAQ